MLRFAALAIIGSLAVASIALAQDAPQPSSPDGAWGQGCRPKHTLVLRGRFLAGGGTSFQMDVRRATRRPRALRGARELEINAHTRFRRDGRPSSLRALRETDRLLVLVRACQPADAMGIDLLAKRVFARSAL
jgi:hypothetical protein